MKRLRGILALVLAAALLLGGCGGSFGVVKYEDMEYARPNLSQYQELLAECTALAEEGTDFDSFETALLEFFDFYNGYYTSYCLADLHYCADLTDLYWSEEYGWFLETYAEVDAAMDQLCYTLADCAFREKLETEEYFGPGYFDGYDGESLWDPVFTGLIEGESALIGEYYDLSAQLAETSGAEYEALTDQLCQLYAELIAQRQEIAAYAGYEDYPHFAYDFYYYRDYTPEQEAACIEEIRQELVPLYREVCEAGFGGVELEQVSEAGTLDYVRSCAKAMGGTVWDAYRLMEDGGLYDIGYGANKYESSFETYLYDYYEPFVFMNPEGDSYDLLTFSHEFGHFCNDYASYGSVAGIDVAEVFSQGMEYLCLCYGEDTRELECLAMVDSLCVFVEQAAYASFESQAYGLTGEELTAENLCALYEQVAEEFAFDVWGVDPQDFVWIGHFYTNPMYVFSYVVSNDAAMQLYQLERQQPGAGLEKYEENLATEEVWFLAFLETAGLESPFEEGRIRRVRQTFEEILQ